MIIFHIRLCGVGGGGGGLGGRSKNCFVSARHFHIRLCGVGGGLGGRSKNCFVSARHFGIASIISRSYVVTVYYGTRAAECCLE